jgi:hypothetical protein
VLRTDAKRAEISENGIDIAMVDTSERTRSATRIEPRRRASTLPSVATPFRCSSSV